jgi:hypothetical protein
MDTPTFDTEQFTTMTLQRLKQEAKRRCIYRYSTLRKDELIAALQRNERDRKTQWVKEQEAAMIREELEILNRKYRQTVLRQQESPIPEHLEYPFQFLGNEYPVEVTPILSNDPGELDVEDFPANIDHYYWVHEGVNDEEPWLTLCKLKNGLYVFYKGECDYTGFDCQGDMRIYAAKDPKDLLLYAMDSNDYGKYHMETKETNAESSQTP